MQKQIEADNDVTKQESFASTDVDSQDSGEDSGRCIPNVPATPAEQQEALMKKIRDRKMKLPEKMKVGSISFNTNNDKEKEESAEPKTIRNVVFNVKSLRSLKNNIGVFSM